MCFGEIFSANWGLCLENVRRKMVLGCPWKLETIVSKLVDFTSFRGVKSTYLYGITIYHLVTNFYAHPSSSCLCVLVRFLVQIGQSNLSIRKIC